jgi:hypothetical protein
MSREGGIVACQFVLAVEQTAEGLPIYRGLEKTDDYGTASIDRGLMLFL